ncbi:MAG TPA: DUF58 domain-containing protein [Planctomycetota bacterium]|nr:DUF58 domain-containing protein [Planctomycetota bacterium]
MAKLDAAAARKYLDPKTLSKASRLEMRARLVVEGYISGMHRSPYHGFSVEFAQHREYAPGDDLKHMDWKVFGRSDRYYIKEYEEETNLRCHIILDTSESMNYASPGHMTKLEYGCYIAATLAYMLLRQQDAVSLTLFDNAIKKMVPSSASPAQLRTVLYELCQIVPEKKTDMNLIFHDLAERVKRRGLVVLISDLFDNAENILRGLQHFRHKRHEVLVFHVLDDAETRFPFKDMTKFLGLESWPELIVDPPSLRKAYVEEYEAFVAAMKKGCLNTRIDYAVMNTSQPLDVALTAYLATRASTRTK